MQQTIPQEQARAALDRAGKSIAYFDREHALPEPTVRKIFLERIKPGTDMPTAQPVC